MSGEIEIKRIPKLNLGRFPTPMYELARLGGALGRRILVKRDDLSGVSTGGNKVRKLEYLLYDAVDQGADIVLTTGGAQSNHAMLTAACCNMLCLEAMLVLKGRGVMGRAGNLMIDELLGAEVRFVDTDSYGDVYAEMARIEDGLRAKGRRPYHIPVGGSVPLGTLGYVDCAREIFSDALEAGVKIDRIVCTAGSGGTMAGLLLGALLYGDGCRVTGVAVDDGPFEDVVAELVNGAAELLGRGDVHISASDADVYPCFGAGYARPSKAGLEAIRLAAKTEGLILDPVYTGKTMAGLVEMCGNGKIGAHETVVFLHSGGIASVFAIDPADIVE
ncbi:MAG: L-cysteate sulfo-lyase [Firmicutes bacterium ADurb.Bin248]|nr:MAG: L-cysteate sulfo-lyase [Firmicutes bacterium ADurb.Bin248]HOG01346.1 D-cysteine desulfhydrase family protein [Clostridia bacterium]